MDDQGHVLVIGAATLDLKAQPEVPLVRGTSIPGRIRSSLGGVARNIAENLARLEVETILLTAVGDDDTGARILGHAAGSGIDISHALIIEGGRSGAYMVLLQKNGSLDVAVDDMGIMGAITPGYIKERRRLFEGASMVVIDANLTPDVILTVIDLCNRYNLPLCADPTSASLAERLRPHLSGLYLVAPNVPETQILCGETFKKEERDEAQAAARRLVSLGVEIAVITLSEHGVVYADAKTKGHAPAIPTEIVDQTGAGDALTATIIFGLLEGIPLDECVRLGVTAASLTLRTRQSVRPDLSVELLYDELIS